MRQGQRGELFRLAPVKIDGGREAGLLYRREIDLELCVQVEKDIPGILFCRDRRVQSGEMADLLRCDRTDAGKAGVHRLCG